MKLHEAPSELVRTIAEETMLLFLEFRDTHGYDEDRARAAAIAEVVEGLGVPIESAETLYGVEMLERLRAEHQAARTAYMEALGRAEAAREACAAAWGALQAVEPTGRGQEQRSDGALGRPR